jgi:hypothetical protein
VPSNQADAVILLFQFLSDIPGAGWGTRKNMEVNMSSEEARSIVEDGLERRREDRIHRDAALEDQARQLRMTISNNHTVRTLSEAQKKAMEAENLRKHRRERAKAKAEKVIREMKMEAAIRKYGVWCLVILLMTAIFRVNVLISLALALGLAVFPAAYIYRLYVPLEDVKA